ncbi:uncharacterized protein PHACADRAFT_257518 [Phanerochaete carnosa HHB-10118-sp]|uniref:Uncharacterized protein n=1 Tax=Phanerochaete carnosa (strain HHB-10118-sp) TaxID=650164 RepID=K5UVE1_PHACS|nr:uncharacterized protein PHACADRAFT_257518 [Phanerochaete carnosa HHB-10118-sp]EKM53981.1 hypothetical protein PHACADRAFT_257518 [Phanerochaete carnosa HHB-10118-sp]
MFLVVIPFLAIGLLIKMCNSEGIADFNMKSLGPERGFNWAIELVARYVGAAFDSDQDFWIKREVKQLAKKEEGDVVRGRGDALARAPAAVARSQLDRLEPCLLSLPIPERTRVMVKWMSFYFGVSDEDFALLDHRSPIALNILSRVNRAFSDTYHQFLLKTLPDEWSSRDWVYKDKDMACILILLTWIYKADFASQLRPIWVPLLIEICESQDTGLDLIESSDDYDVLRYPTVCLFESAVTGLYKFNSIEVDRMVSLATKRIPWLVEINQRFENDYLEQTVDMALGAVAASLHAVSQDEHATYDKPENIRHLLEEFDRFVVAQRQGIRYMANLSLKQPDQVLVVTRKAMKSIVDPLLTLAQGDRLPIEIAQALVQNLMETCEEQRAFEDIMPSLNRLSELVPTRTYTVATSAPPMPIPDIIATTSMPSPDITDKFPIDLSNVALPVLPLHNPSYSQVVAGGDDEETDWLLHRSVSSIPMQTYLPESSSADEAGNPRNL